MTANYTWTGTHIFTTGQFRPAERTFAGLPTAGAGNLGREFNVTDCLTTACTAGGGSLAAKMRSNGSAWVCMTCPSSTTYNAGASTSINNYVFPWLVNAVTGAVGTTPKISRVVSSMTGSVTKCSVNIATVSAGSTVDIAIYSLGTDGTTTTLLGQTEVVGTSLGVVAGNLSATAALQAGAPYYLTAVGSDATVALTSSPVGGSTVLVNLLSTGTAGASHGTAAAGFSGGVFLASLGTLTTGNTAQPVINCHN